MLGDTRKTILVICILSFSDALQSNILLTFLPFAVRHWGKPENENAFWVGVLSTCFFLPQAVMTPAWGWVSDRIGRRPVLLFGVMAICVSMAIFAFAPTFYVACIARVLAGALNGNLAVTKTYIVEATDKSSVAAGFSSLAVTWGAAQLFAPIVSGALYDPASQFAQFVAFRSSVFVDFPSMLPCLFSVCYSLFAFTVGYILLLETNAFTRRSSADTDSVGTHAPTVSKAKPAAVTSSVLELLADPTVLACVGMYCLLSATQITFDVLSPTFLQMSAASGGLGLSARGISIAQFVAGTTNLLSQLVIVPALISSWGAVLSYRRSMAATLLVALIPVCGTLAADAAFPAAVLFFMIRSVAQGFAFTSMNILTGACSGGRELGLVSGISMSSGAIVRAVVPSVAGAIFSASLSSTVLGSFRLYPAFSLITIASLSAVHLSHRLPSWIETQNGAAGSSSAVHPGD
jgi:MFS family permease